MVKEIRVSDYKVLKESTITINCDLLTSFNRSEFVKKLIDLCDEYKEGVGDIE